MTPNPHITSTASDQRALPIAWLSADDPDAPAIPEFYQREYGLNAVHLNSLLDRASSGEMILAHAFQWHELESLSQLPAKTVRLLLSSDETYLPAYTKALLSLDPVSEVIRNYPFHPPKWKSLFVAPYSAIRELIDARGQGMVSAAHATAAGFSVAARSSRSTRALARSGKPIQCIPLGYSDLFLRGIKILAAEGVVPHPPATGSLLPYFDRHRDHFLQLKSRNVAFVGQAGKFQRRCAIDQALHAGWTIGPIRETYGGGSVGADTAARQYVEALLFSSFALCPPGNYSGDSFRLTEACLMSCIPIEVHPVISDPLRPTGLWHGDHALIKATWKGAFKQLSMLNPGQARRLADGAFNSISANIRTASQLVRDGSTLK